MLSPLTLLRAFVRRFGRGIVYAFLLALVWVAILSNFRWAYWHPFAATFWLGVASAVMVWAAMRGGHKQAGGVMVMAFLAILFEASIFIFFNRIFGNFLRLEELGALDFGELRLRLVEQLLRLIFTLSMSLLFLSMTSAALSAIYLSADAAPLLLAPRHWLYAFLARFTTAAASVSYMVFGALVPILLALGWQFKAPLFYYALLPAVLLLLFLPPLAAGATACALLIRFFPVGRLQQLLSVVSLVSVAGLVILVRAASPEKLFNPSSDADLLEIAKSINIEGLDRLPGAWAARLLTRAVENDWSWMAFQPLALTALAAGLVLGWLAITYGRTYARAAERTSTLRITTGWWPARPVAILWLKDARLFARDAKEWSQLLMLGALMVIYLYNIRKMPSELQVYRTAVVFINLAILGFILAALNLRFTFSAMALEGPGVWALLKAPLPRSRLLVEKTLFTFIPLSGFALVLSFFAGRLMHLEPALLGLSLGISLIFAVTLHLMALAFGLGQYEPPAADPVKMALSPGGLGYMAASLLYVIGGLILVARLIISRLHPAVDSGYGPLFLLLAVSALLCILSYLYARRRLETLEW